MKADQSSVDAWLERARELRAAMFEDEASFFLFLVDGENGAVDWVGTASSFEELLDRAELCRVARYVSFRESLSFVPRECASRIGVDGVIDAAQVKSDDDRKRVLLSLEETRERRGHPLSGRDVKRVIQQLAPVPRNTRDLTRVLKRSKLELENESLRKRVRELEKQVATLEAKLAKASRVRKAS